LTKLYRHQKSYFDTVKQLKWRNCNMSNMWLVNQVLSHAFLWEKKGNYLTKLCFHTHCPLRYRTVWYRPKSIINTDQCQYQYRTFLTLPIITASILGLFYQSENRTLNVWWTYVKSTLIVDTFNAFALSMLLFPLSKSCRRLVFHHLWLKVDDEIRLQIFPFIWRIWPDGIHGE
jgi:hypothetical protein